MSFWSLWRSHVEVRDLPEILSTSMFPYRSTHQMLIKSFIRGIWIAGCAEMRIQCGRLGPWHAKAEPGSADRIRLYGREIPGLRVPGGGWWGIPGSNRGHTDFQSGWSPPSLAPRAPMRSAWQADLDDAGSAGSFPGFSPFSRRYVADMWQEVVARTPHQEERFSASLAFSGAR